MDWITGWEFRRKHPEDDKPQPAFTPPVKDDGAVLALENTTQSVLMTDDDGTLRTEAELVSKYRTMALTPEIDMAVEEIANEAINVEEDKIVKLNFNKLEALPEKVRVAMEGEFTNVLQLLQFNTNAHDIFRRWYIDGRMYYYVLLDPNNLNKGIRELRYIDSRKMRKIRQISKRKSKKADVVITQVDKEFYLFNENGFAKDTRSPIDQGDAAKGIKIAADSIVHVTSGLLDVNNKNVLSYLHKAIRPLNQLRMLEDATIIYRLARAPERRVWYIDVGNLPKMKAEQYVRNLMTSHKNKLAYDASTGEVRDDRKFQTMLEDYWLPRREGGKGTEVTTLPGGQSLGKMEDVDYFKALLYSSLNVPLDRLNSDSGFQLGRSAEITREEVKFGKFIDRLRTRFSGLFLQLLEKQVVLKQIMSIEDWKKIKDLLQFDFARDSYFTELKNQEIFNSRATTAIQFDPYVGKYYSHYWIRKNIFKMSKEEMDEEDARIAEEKDNPQFQNPLEQMGDDQNQPQPDGSIPGNPADQAQNTVNQFQSKGGPGNLADDAKLRASQNMLNQ